MAKITDLAVVDTITGDEFLPIVQRGATKRATMTALRALIVPFLQAWYKGDKGDPGAAGNVAATLAQLQNAPIVNASMIAAYDGSGSTMTWTAGDFAARAAMFPAHYVKAASVSLTQGAWVRQQAVGLNFDGRTIEAKLQENASVTDRRFAGGARGDGVTDDTAAFAAALAAARNVYVPPGRYLIRRLKIPSFRRLYGAGKSPWEPYTGTDKPVDYLSELIVDAGDAIDARGTFCVTLTGLAFAARDGTQSRYRFAPGFQAGTGGVAITGSSQFQARDVSFFGLEYAVHSHLTTATVPGGGSVAGVETDERNASANPTQMPCLDDWQASDCRVVVAFGNAASDRYTVRDAKISNEVVALHCESIARLHWCDGVRMENVRYYQCTGNSILMRRCIFVDLVGVCVFETGADAVVLQECENVDASGGLMIGRSGYYAVPTGTDQAPIYPQHAALRLDRCITTHIAGLIEKPTGMAVDADQSTTLLLNVACDTPFWQTGNATNLSGAVDLRQCDHVTANLSVGGENHWIALWVDPQTSRTLAGSVSGNPVGGVVRATRLHQQGAYRYRFPAAQEMGNGGVLPFDVLRMLVPPGKKLVTRSVEMMTTGVTLRANGLTWVDQTLPEPGGGSIAFDNKVLFENATDAFVYCSVPLALVNLSGAPVTAMQGDVIALSTALI